MILWFYHLRKPIKRIQQRRCSLSRAWATDKEGEPRRCYWRHAGASSTHLSSWLREKFKLVTWPEWTREFNSSALCDLDYIDFRLNKLIQLFLLRYILLFMNFQRTSMSFLYIFNVHFKKRIFETNMSCLSFLTSTNIIRKKASETKFSVNAILLTSLQHFHSRINKTFSTSIWNISNWWHTFFFFGLLNFRSTLTLNELQIFPQNAEQYIFIVMN